MWNRQFDAICVRPSFHFLSLFIFFACPRRPDRRLHLNTRIFSELCRWGAGGGGGGGEIPKGGRAGRARFLRIWPQGG